MDNAVLILRPAAGRTLFAVLLSAAISLSCGAGFWAMRSNGHPINGLLGGLAVLFVLLSGLGCISLAFPTSLVLTSEGFFMTGIGKTPLVAWSAVEEFVRFNRGPQEGLGFRLKAGESVGRGWKHLAFDPRVDGEIALNLTTSVGETFRILKEWKQAHSAAISNVRCLAKSL